MTRIAYFISPHGFGHAARAAAVMEAMAAANPSLRFEIFTTVPVWFFEDNLSELFRYHCLLNDLGFVQRNAFEPDIDRTMQQLDRMLPYDESQVFGISTYLRRINCELIICDIAPLGLLIARRAEITSVLVENFTWDWIYNLYAEYRPQIQQTIEYLGRLYELADLHVQTQPLCYPKAADLSVGPVSRKIKSARKRVRDKLGLPCGHKLVMITTGGIPQEYQFLKKLHDLQDIHFVIPCGCSSPENRKNLTLLPHHSEYFHPDLVNASDAVIGKAGYSTIAEVYHAGVAFGFIPCSHNPEAEKLVQFIRAEISCNAISEIEFHTGSWIERVESLVNMPRIKRSVPNGADLIAEFILGLRY
jgi:hypothetical protein